MWRWTRSPSGRTRWRAAAGLLAAAVVGALAWELLGPDRRPVEDRTDVERAAASPATPSLRGLPGTASAGRPRPVAAPLPPKPPPGEDEGRDAPFVVVAGSVLDESGVGVEGIPLVAGTPEKRRDHFAPPRGVPVAWSGPDGGFAARVPASPWTQLEVGDAPGWVRPGPVSVGDGGAAVFRLRRAVLVRGVVLDPEGRPAPNAVLFVAWPGTPGPLTKDVEEDGRFEVPVPSNVPRVELRVLAGVLEGAEPEIRAEVDVASARETPAVLRFERASVLEGILVGPEGEPVVGARLTAQRADGVQLLYRGAESGPDGRFRFDALGRGPHWVLVHPPAEYAAPDPLRLEVPAAGIELECPRGTTLRGRLVGPDTGGFLLTWTWGRSSGYPTWPHKVAKSAADGAFSVPSVAEGNTVLYAWRPGDPRYARIERPLLAQDLEVHLQVGRPIAGRVVLPEGGLTTGLQVRLLLPDAWVYTEASPDGSFRFAGVPAGVHRLGFSYGPRTGEFRTKAPVEVGTTDLVLTLP